MYEYPVSTEIARLTIILGIVVATVIYKQTGMTLGGVIIPGYLALYVLQPFHILATLAIATLAYYIVHNFLKKRYMLNGRRLFEVEILVALVLQVVWNALLSLTAQYSSQWLALYGIGFIIPGLITHEIGRQGLRRTLFSTLLGTLIVFLIIAPLAAIQEQLPPWMSMISTSPILRTQPYPYAFPLVLLPIAIILSVIVDLLLYSRFKTRPGGFVTAAYVALFYPRPWDLLFILVAAVLTYFLVNFLTDRYLLVFGRTKLGMIILMAVVVAWLMEIAVINLTHGQFAPWSGFVVIMPMLVGLLSNGFNMQGMPKTLATVGISSAAVWLGMQGLILALSAMGLYAYFG